MVLPPVPESDHAHGEPPAEVELDPHPRCPRLTTVPHGLLVTIERPGHGLGLVRARGADGARWNLAVPVLDLPHAADQVVRAEWLHLIRGAKHLQGGAQAVGV